MDIEKFMRSGEVVETVADLLIKNWITKSFPSSAHQRTSLLLDCSLRSMFPQFSDSGDYSRDHLREDLTFVRREINDLGRQLGFQDAEDAEESSIGNLFVSAFPELRRRLTLDALAIFNGDPAGESVDEVILAYPGFMATAIYRIAHCLWEQKFPLIPRLMSTIGQGRTGVDIHPGAQIGRDFCIDHGTGIVIGETAMIGNGVKLYQGVTLGAVSVQKGLAKTKRHPMVEDNVIVYANATILGGETVIGHDCIVSGNAFITESIPPFSVVFRNGEFRPRRPGQPSDLEYYI